MKKSILIVTATILALMVRPAVRADASPVRAATGKVKVFLLSGQSNMTGRGMQGWPDVPLEEQKHTLFHFVNRPENLIQDLRKDLHAPGLKTVVAVTGNWGWDMADLKASIAQQAEKHPGFDRARGQEWIDALRTIQEAQLAVARREAFKGTVATAETRDFWRPRAAFGGHGTEQHWCANGESYWLIGEAMGREMVQLLESGRAGRTQ